MLPILNQSFWRDEAFSVLLSQKSPLRIIALTIKDQSPPLYLLILHYWMLAFGQSEVAVRGLSFLFHITLVIVVFFLARKLVKSTTTQLLITAAVLLNPFLLQYAFEARPYSLLALLTTLAVYLIASRRHLLTGVVLSLGILTHNFGLFNFMAVGIWWIATNRKQLKTRLVQGVFLMALPSITVLSWGLVIWNQWERVGSGFWIKQVTTSIFIDSFQKYSQGDISYPSQHMMFLISLILLFFAFSYWVWKKDREETHIPALLFAIALIPIGITYAVSALFVPIYHERYLISTVPMLILLIGYSLNQTLLFNPARKILLIVFVSAYFAILVLSSGEITGQTTKSSINWAVRQILSRA